MANNIKFTCIEEAGKLLVVANFFNAIAASVDSAAEEIERIFNETPKGKQQLAGMRQKNATALELSIRSVAFGLHETTKHLPAEIAAKGGYGAMTEEEINSKYKLIKDTAKPALIEGVILTFKTAINEVA